MNEFLKYLKMIPVIIYPYIYVLILAVFFLFVDCLLYTSDAADE